MSKEITKEQVEKIARLANLMLTKDEVEKFTLQLGEVIDYNIGKLNKVDTKKVKPLLNISGLENVLRNDETEAGISQEAALKNGKEIHNGFFQVKQILEQ